MAQENYLYLVRDKYNSLYLFRYKPILENNHWASTNEREGLFIGKYQDYDVIVHQENYILTKINFTS